MITIVSARHTAIGKGMQFPDQQPHDFGRLVAYTMGMLMRRMGYVFDLVVTSPQMRAVHTAREILRGGLQPNIALKTLSTHPLLNDLTTDGRYTELVARIKVEASLLQSPVEDVLLADPEARECLFTKANEYLSVLQDVLVSTAQDEQTILTVGHDPMISPMGLILKRVPEATRPEHLADLSLVGGRLWYCEAIVTRWDRHSHQQTTCRAVTDIRAPQWLKDLQKELPEQ